MADVPKGQEAGGGEGAPANIPKENAAVETKAAEEVKEPVSCAKIENQASIQEQVNVKETAVIPTSELPNVVAVQETKPEEILTNPENAENLAKPEDAQPVETLANMESAQQEESLTNLGNTQPEQVHVEEIKSDANPVKIDVVPEQVLVQQILIAASADKAEEAPEQSKEETKPELEPPVTEAPVSNDDVKNDEIDAKDSGDWQQREQELLKKIEQLEEVKGERSEDRLKLELKIREEEVDLLKARVKNLETELQAALSKPGGKNQEMIEKIKQQHEELLSKARGMIFDKTKVVKNQELQIEALTTQIQSLKDINVITKDLLEIRNSEVKAMEERLEVMEARFKKEKERYDLVLKRAQTSTNINDDLRKEYETQLGIFKELREKYELRVQALVAENNRLKESLQGGSSG